MIIVPIGTIIKFHNELISLIDLGGYGSLLGEKNNGDTI